jgi:hypothetical protein
VGNVGVSCGWGGCPVGEGVPGRAYQLLALPFSQAEQAAMQPAVALNGIACYMLVKQLLPGMVQVGNCLCMGLNPGMNVCLALCHIVPRTGRAVLQGAGGLPKLSAIGVRCM